MERRGGHRGRRERRTLGKLEEGISEKIKKGGRK